jgi:hypothetical protein
MPFISDTQLARVQNAMSAQGARIQRAKKKAEEKAGEAKTVAEMVAGAGAVGFIRGKMEDKSTGAWNIPGTTIDIEMAAGLGLVGAAFFDVFGKYDEDVLAIGGGVLAHYAGQVFRKYGQTGNFALVAGRGEPQLVGAGHRSANAALHSALSAY